ncbi:MAG TPA: hypothetical protein VHS57_04935 [Acidimicrobiales bacterium]|nr:hypothetical protein [Acidimicrobiales bacterium]
MARFRMFVIAATSMLIALPVAALGAPPAGAGNPTSPPLVGATNWTNASAAAGSAENELDAVTCATASFCVAVGVQSESTGQVFLIQQWNGTSWSVVTGVTAPASNSDRLNGVSCAGPSFCMAVGSVTSTGGGTAFAETWNGTSWTAATPAPPAGSTFSYLSSVSCVAANSCATLGTSFAGSTPTVFGNQWNGTSWTAVPAATPTAGANQEIEATGMDCISGSQCLAVGNTNGNGTNGAPFAEQWNGSAWSLANTGISTTLPGGSFLRSVSCAGASFCQAVGQVGGSTTQNLIEMWNGTTWSVPTSTPQTSTSLAQRLTGVHCISATSCSAVGWSNQTSGQSPATLALNWNGSSWSIVPNTPNGSGTGTKLMGETCLTNWSCVAVGFQIFASTPFSAFAMSAPIARSGYRFVASDGGVFAYGAGAPFLGSTGNLTLNAPVVGMGVMPAGDGYYLAASDGGVFNYGSAQFDGSAGAIHLNKPVVGMAVTPDGAGYWLVATDGGIFSYGDAQFYGSTGALTLNKPIVGMAPTPDGKGYWLVASDGGIFSYGDATFYGSTGALTLNKPVVGMSVPVAGGYYLVAADGGIFSFPAASAGGPPFLGSTGAIKLNKPIVGMTTATGGYYLSGSDGGVFTFGTNGMPPFLGSTGAITLNKPIVGIAS